MNQEPWKEHPYINGIKSISQAARSLSKSLKKLSTYIRKIIERMILEETFESLTDHLIEYFDGSFVKEYARLARQQNVYRYRGVIRNELDKISGREELMERITLECAEEEVLGREEAGEYLEELFQQTKRFLFEYYEKIMKDIKHKINVYLQVGIGRARFLRNREIDEKNYVERTIRTIAEEYRKLYFFVRKHQEMFTDYFSHMGYEVVIDQDNKVAMLRNGKNDGVVVNRHRFRKYESIVLCCLWTLYVDQIREGNLARPIIITVFDLRQTMEKYGVKEEMEKSQTEIGKLQNLQKTISGLKDQLQEDWKAEQAEEQVYAALGKISYTAEEMR